MLTGALLALLAAEPPKIAANGFVCASVAPEVCEAYFERFVSVLTRQDRVKVLTQRDIQAVLGLERQKQLLGCSDEGCMAELAGALAVDGILTANLAKTQSGYLVTIKITRARDGSKWVSASRRAPTELDVQDALDEAAYRFRDELNEKPHVDPTRVITWSALLLGAASFVTGAVLYGLSQADAGSLRSDEPMSPDEVHKIASRGKTLQPLGATMMGVAVPLIVSMVLVLVLSRSEVLALVPTQDGAAIAFGGSWF